MLRLGPQPDADARAQPSGATASLIRRRTRAAHGGQPAHARGRIEAIAALKPAVDNDPNALNSEARLGDVGREHDLAPAAGGGTNRGVLGIGRKIAKERHDASARVERHWCRADVCNAPDLRGARQKYKNIARPHSHVRARTVRTTSCSSRGVLACAPRRYRVSTVEAASAGAHDRRVIHQASHCDAIERRRHDKEPQVLAHGRLRIETKRERQIRLEIAFVKLIENDERHALERRIRCRRRVRIPSVITSIRVARETCASRRVR